MPKLVFLVICCEFIRAAFAASAALEARRAVRQLQRQEPEEASASPANAAASHCEECRRLQEQKEEQEEAKQNNVEQVANAEDDIKEEKDRIAALPLLISQAKNEALEERKKRATVERLLEKSKERKLEAEKKSAAGTDDIRANITRQKRLMTARAAEEARLIDVAKKAAKDAKEEVECENQTAQGVTEFYMAAVEDGKKQQRSLDAAEASKEIAARDAVNANLTAQLEEYKQRAEASESGLKSKRDADRRSQELRESEKESKAKVKQWKKEAREEALKEAEARLKNEKPPSVPCNCSSQRVVTGVVTSTAAHPTMPPQEVVVPDSVTNTMIEPTGTGACGC